MPIIKSEDFDKNKYDNYLYIKISNIETTYVIIFVNNVLFSGSSIKQIENLKLNLNISE